MERRENAVLRMKRKEYKIDFYSMTLGSKD
jgi:hypothetical protein